jgi:anaerobic selenocysteine-containing dehydrogenase
VIERRSYCRICAASCGIVVTIDGDQVVGIRGDDTNPRSLGYTCSKGRALDALHHHPARLDRPIRNGVALHWTDLLDDLANELTRIVDAIGPNAVGAYCGTGLAYDTAGWIAATAWLRSIGSTRLFTPATIDNAPVLRAAELVGGHPQLNPVCDHDVAEVVLVFGSNPVVSHGYGTALANPIPAFRSVAERGALWVFDPVKTATAQLGRHLSVRPGSDVFVLAALVRAVLDAPLTDEARLATTPADRRTLRLAVSPFTTERAANEAGIEVSDLEAVVADILRARGALAAWCGTGVTMSRDGLAAETLRWALLALTGSLDTESGMRFRRGNVFALRPARSPAVPANGPASRPELSGWLGQQPCVALNDEIESGNLRALVVAGGNPLTAFPQPDRTYAALTALDSLAVLDVVANDSTAIATHVLPVTSQLERADLPMHEHVSGTAAAFHTPAVVRPGADRRPAWWVFAQLAKRMTGTDLFGREPDSLHDDDVLGLVAARAVIPYADIVAAGPHGIMLPPDVGWVRATLRADAAWAIAPPLLVDRLAALAARAPTSRSVVVVPRRRRRTNNSVADPHDRDEPIAIVHPQTAAAGPATITSAAGRVDVRLAADDRVRPGVVSMSHGDLTSSPGHLVSDTDEVDPETGMPVASGIAVTIEVRS